MINPNQLTILFVGTTPQVVELLSDELRQGGFHIQSEAVDDAETVTRLLEASFDFVVIDTSQDQHHDISMIISAFAEKNWDIPLLAYSEADDLAAVVEIMKAGAQDFISSHHPQRILPAIRRELVALEQRATMRKQSQMQTLMHDIDNLMLQDWDVVPLVEKVCQFLNGYFGFKLVWIGGKRVDGSVNVVAAAGEIEYLNRVRVRWDEKELADGPVGKAIRSKKPSVSEIDTQAFAPWREQAEQFGIKSVLALPMIASGAAIGVLVFYSDKHAAFDEVNIARYREFADRLAITLMMAQEHQQFRLLSTAMQNATQALFITKLDGTIVWFNHALSEFSGYTANEIMDSTPYMFNSGGYESGHMDEMWHTIRNGRIWTGEVQSRHKNGSIYSVMQSITPLYDQYGELTHFLFLQQDISEKKKLEQKIEYLAYHDILTGLPNRTLFNDRLNQAISQAKRDQTEFSILFVDLDGFKSINDTYGHAAGDQLLKIVAGRLRLCVREGDTVARLGGDEFMVLLRDVDTDHGVRSVTHKVIERIAKPYELDVGQAYITSSIGISRYPDDGVLAEKLMSHADEAMYSAKRAGKNRYAMWHMPPQTVDLSDRQIESGAGIK